MLRGFTTKDRPEQAGIATGVSKLKSVAANLCPGQKTNPTLTRRGGQRGRCILILVEIKDETSARHYRGVLKEFFHRLALVIKTHQDFSEGIKGIWKCRGERCSFKNIKMNWKAKNGKFFMEFPLSDNYSFFLEAFSLDKYFNKMRIFVQNEKDIGIRRNPLELMLFLNACYQQEVPK